MNRPNTRIAFINDGGLRTSLEAGEVLIILQTKNFFLKSMKWGRYTWKVLLNSYNDNES